LIGVTTSESDKASFARLKVMLSQAGIVAYVILPQHAGDLLDGVQHLIDVHGDFVRLYGMIGYFLCLIRPDDHIGLFQRPINERTLVEYLSWLSPSPTLVGKIGAEAT
jgi:hypothetical protein